VNQKIDHVIAHSPSYSYQDLLDKERNPVPDSLREDTQTYLGSEDLPTERWTSQEFFDEEVEKVWKKTWQMACRESHIPEPGDYHVYEIAHFSILVMRTESGQLKAYYNSCLHRGRVLKQGTGHADEVRCPYHGFTWNLDGSFREAPCLWDFEHVKQDEFNLPEVRVDTWGGWVFINMDPDSQDLHDYLGILPQHFERWTPENRYIALHVEKVINCNWKAGVEAFIESYHAVQTHPQIMPYQGIDNSQYDVWDDHISRTITTMATINPSHEDVYSEQDSINAMLGTASLVGEAENEGDGVVAREHLARINYEDFSEQAGIDFNKFATVSEMMDAILYLVFPNFAPWAGFHPALTYRHRPNGSDPNSCIMDIFILNNFPEGEERPADAVTTRLTADQPFSDAAELGENLGRIFNQDGANLPQVQKGMLASGKGAVTLGNYQEVRIRHFHQTLDKYLSA
jgi:phenylpropionate dioxygenase-like ring-hydroxylating dioxygenase large terminal subunit